MLNASEIQRLLDIANVGCHNGHVVQARTIYEGVLAVNPGFAPARIGLAYSHLVVDEFDTAENLLNEVLAAVPTDTDAQALLGLVYTLAGRSTQAEATLRPLTTGQGAHAELAENLLKTL